MSDADAAYGIFAANRDPSLPIAKIGMGGQVQPQSPSFAKGKYYVEIVVSADDAHINFTRRCFRHSDKMAGADRRPRHTAGGAGVVSARDDLASAGLGSRERAGPETAEARLCGEVQAGAGIHRAGSFGGVGRRGAEEASRALRRRCCRQRSATRRSRRKAQYLEGVCFFRKGRILAGYANLPDAQQAAAQAAKLAARIP